MATILQISDPHLMNDRQGRLKAVPTAETLAAVLQEARRRCPRPAAVVWTGDLSHEESRAGYQRLRELAADWLECSYVIPGNHDNRAALRDVFPEVEGDADGPVSFHVWIDQWQIIGLDTHVPGDAAGALAEEQLEQLHYWLAANPGQPTLLFMHHPPIGIGCQWLDSIKLANPEPLEVLLSRNPGVRGVFCGHVHCEREAMFAGARLFTTPSTAFQFEVECPEVKFDLIPPGFRVITLENDQFSTAVVRVADLDCPPCMD